MGGGGVSASILLRGEGMVIRGGGLLRRKNLQISDLQRLASLYVDLPDFNEIWPKCSSDINASKCVRLKRNSKYFFAVTC